MRRLLFSKQGIGDLHSLDDLTLECVNNELEMTEYKCLKEVAEFIRFYNFVRKYSSLEYLNPNILRGDPNKRMKGSRESVRTSIYRKQDLGIASIGRQ